MFDGLVVEQAVPRQWLATYVDPNTRLESIGGTVHVFSQWLADACGVNASKPSDAADLAGLEVRCSITTPHAGTSGATASSPALRLRRWARDGEAAAVADPVLMPQPQ